MFDILSAIFHDDPLQFATVSSLHDPQTTAGRQVKSRLIGLDAEVTKELETRIDALVWEQSELAFCSGARFGAQLMAQFLEGHS